MMALSYFCQKNQMFDFIKKYRILIITFILFSIVTVSLFYNALKPQKTLPIYNPADVNPELVDSTVQFVADFFFTTCGSICPIMTTNMIDVQKAFVNNPKVMMLSHTVTPEIDSVPVLKKYALEKGVIDSKWNLVTGDKKDIYRMARKSYLAVKLGKPEELYDMVHTENFVLVDAESRVRGFYDGTKKEDIQKLIEDIQWLLTEDKN
jgi:protein SCO1/2